MEVDSTSLSRFQTWVKSQIKEISQLDKGPSESLKVSKWNRNDQTFCCCDKQPPPHQHCCFTFQLIGSGCVMFKIAYSAYPCWCLQVSRLSPPVAVVMQPHFFTVSTTPADAILLAAEHAAVSPALLNYILCGVRGATVYMFNCTLALLPTIKSPVHAPSLLCTHCSFSVCGCAAHLCVQGVLGDQSFASCL